MPLVSIIVPCYNEESTIQLLLDAIYGQTIPCQEMEVIIADGMSTDGTRQQIEAFCRTKPELTVRVVDNPRRIIPAGLNRALDAATGDTIIRLDGHSQPSPDYVERCLAALEAGRGDNVGGRWQIQPRGKHWIARAIAVAAAHPLGVGDARYRIGGQAQEVDTVPFGAFRRSLVERVGRFDENLLTNEDYEFNTRIRKSGGKIWFDPQIKSTYYAPGSFKALARQYGRYGFWKVRMLARYPATLRWRQALPPLFVLLLIILAVGSIPLPGMRFWLVLQLVSYITVLLLAGVQVAFKKSDPALVVGLPTAIGLMHLTWGGAFLWSLLRLILVKDD